GDAIWWESLPEAQQTKLTSLFESNWFQNDIDEDKRIAYAYSAQQIYDFLATNKDSSPNDSYVGFAPLLLRASFHGAGSYTHATGTGGSNGGTIFNHAELADAQNGCIAGATTELFDLFHGQENVPLADTVVIAGVVALDSMDFPRMDLLSITGGRDTVSNVANRDRLPSADDDPLTRFTKQYDLTVSQTVALIGGSHNFGSAHGDCSGYVGQWTATPLSWFGPDRSDPSFFSDLLKEDWRWYQVCTYANDTVSYVSVEDPFANGLPEEEEEAEGEVDACLVASSGEAMICEEQAMRGCDFEDGVYAIDASPCDINLLQMRLKSDFFLKANEAMMPYAETFASYPDVLAEEFGKAYHKITHNGLERCGLSGHGCPEGYSCQQLGEDTLTQACVFDAAEQNGSSAGSTEDDEALGTSAAESATSRYVDDDDDKDSVFIGLLAVVMFIGCVTLALVFMVFGKLNKVLEGNQEQQSEALLSTKRDSSDSSGHDGVVNA
ncbi:MAG: hypothetical protein SGBAC_012853, partial [Bacillariaceae sp.]